MINPFGMSGAITTEHAYELPVSPATVWEHISDVDAYRTWWSWLRRFRAGGLEAGQEWQCEVQPPVPYLVRFQVHLEHVAAPTAVRARIAGDVVGTAELALSETEDGCRAVLSSSLAPGNVTLRLVSRVAAPIARFGHDWVLDSGARLFIARALAPSGAE